MRFWLAVGSLVFVSGCGLDPNVLSNLNRASVDEPPAGKPSARFQLRHEFGAMQSASGPDQTCIAIERATVEDMKKYQPLGPAEYWVYGSRLYTPKGKAAGSFEPLTNRFLLVSKGTLSGYAYEQRLTGAINSSVGQWTSIGRAKDGTVACQVVYPVKFVVEKVFGVRKRSPL